MRRTITALAAACAVFAFTAGVASAQTVPPDRLTHVTFSGPVSVPGMTLPAGTYTFRIMDSNTDRNIVQIFNNDGTKILTTLLAVPATRMEPSGDPVITFKETPSTLPPAVHYWYYAGDLAGNELVYPKNQAQLIANASGESVMSVDSTGSTIDDMKSGAMSRVKPQANTQSTTSDTTTAQEPKPAPPAITAQPQAAPKPEPQPTTAPVDQSAQPSTPPASTVATPETSTAVATSGRTETTLPKTASQLPMIGLIGLLALGGAITLRVARTI